MFSADPTLATIDLDIHLLWQYSFQSQDQPRLSQPSSILISALVASPESGKEYYLRYTPARCLDDRADCNHRRAQENLPRSSQPVACQDCAESAEEAADVVDRSHRALRICRWVPWIRLRKSMPKRTIAP